MAFTRRCGGRRWRRPGARPPHRAYKGAGLSWKIENTGNVRQGFFAAREQMNGAVFSYWRARHDKPRIEHVLFGQLQPRMAAPKTLGKSSANLRSSCRRFL